jgi:hypothetical protein
MKMNAPTMKNEGTLITKHIRDMRHLDKSVMEITFGQAVFGHRMLTAESGPIHKFLAEWAGLSVSTPAQ